MSKKLIVFAGPNGSGKSTLTTSETLKHFGIPADRYINADDIARTLRTEIPNASQSEHEDRIRSRYERTMTLLPRIAEEADRFWVYDNSAHIPAVFALEDNVSLNGDGPVPAILQDRLLIPLARRAAERTVLLSHFGPTTLPNLEHDPHVGPVHWLSQHYAVQSTEKGYVCHDQLLLSRTVLTVGETLTITYRDGQGAVNAVGQ